MRERPSSAGNTELQVNIMRDLGVKGYMSTPTFLMNVVKKADELGYNFRKEFKLRTAIVWGEPLLPEVRRTLEQDYGITIADGIGVGVGLIFGCECTREPDPPQFSGIEPCLLVSGAPCALPEKGFAPPPPNFLQYFLAALDCGREILNPIIWLTGLD